MTDMDLDALTAIRLIESEHMTEYRQVQFPKTKKKRIQEKWRKNPRYWATVPMQDAIKLPDGTLVCHPEFAAKVRAVFPHATRPRA